MNIKVGSFGAADNTWVVAVGWLRQEHAFHPECLLIPSAEIPRFATERDGYFHFQWMPGGGRHSWLEPYRKPLADLARLAGELLGETAG